MTGVVHACYVSLPDQGAKEGGGPRMSRQTIIAATVCALALLLSPKGAAAFSLMAAPADEAPALSLLGEASLLEEESPLTMDARWRLLAAQMEPPTEESVREAAPEEIKPQWIRPHPGWGDYAIDLALAAVATFAWKRALNVTAARRILVESYDDWGDKLSAQPPINDGNLWLTNWVLHPMLGMYYYQWFRSRGHSRMLSALGVFIESTFHEYIIESSFEPASGIDLLLTPGLGIPLGILTDEVSVRWVRSDSTTKRVLAYVMNPFLTMPWSRWRRDIAWNPREDRLSIRLGFDF